MQNNIQDFYDTYWKEKAHGEKFENYERNLAIKKFFVPGEKVLDLASGEGVVSEYIQKLGCNVTAFDISREALNKAKAKGVITVWGNVEEKLPFKQEEFDCVFWGDNIEHVFAPQKILDEIRRVLKPKGKLIISCPNMAYWRYRLYYLFFGMVPQTEWYGKGSWEWEHIRFFNKDELKKLLLASGFTVNNFFGVSKRKIDKLLMAFSPESFGMVMVIEASKS